MSRIFGTQSTTILPLATGSTTDLHKSTSAATQNAKIEKSAKDFESILLGNWLQQAEQSFASLPGGDADGDDDVGKDQYQGMAMQSLGASMTASGGIGIAKMISKQLHKQDEAPRPELARRSSSNGIPSAN
jgi:Rod binding domain-containing protein